MSSNFKMNDLNKGVGKNSNDFEKRTLNYKIFLGVLFLVVIVVGVIYFYNPSEEIGETNAGEEKIVVKNTDDCYKYFDDDKLEKCLEFRNVDLAITNKDVSYCEKVSDSVVKEKCIEVAGAK